MSNMPVSVLFIHSFISHDRAIKIYKFSSKHVVREISLVGKVYIGSRRGSQENLHPISRIFRSILNSIRPTLSFHNLILHTKNPNEKLPFFSHSSCSTHLLNKGVYQLPDHHWACDDRSAISYSFIYKV